MKLKKIKNLLLILTLIINTNVFSQKVENSLVYVAKGGGWANKWTGLDFIENPLLVSEPHGAYIEHSLYYNYKTTGDRIYWFQEREITHRFELPEGSVIHDIWVWMEDSVMQRITLDSWSRSSKDSIIIGDDLIKEPIRLTKIGDQYELKMHQKLQAKPSFYAFIKKIKLSFLTPVKWSGAQAMAELPLNFLKVNAEDKLPLSVYFKTKNHIWGIPSMVEVNNIFEAVADTSGYLYQKINIEDIRNLSSLRLKYKFISSNGVFFTSKSISNDLNYFQFGIKPFEVFTSLPKKVVFGIDLSGYNWKDFSSLFPNLKSSIKSVLKTGDEFNIIVAGPREIKPLSVSLIPFSFSNVDSIINQFLLSPLANTINNYSKPTVFFASRTTWFNWWWNGNNYSNLVLGDDWYGVQFDEIKKQNRVLVKDFRDLRLIASMDSVFQNSGIIIQNAEENNEYANIQRHYIPSFSTDYSLMLPNAKIRKTNGGHFSDVLPESLIVKHSFPLGPIVEDENTRIEMVDTLGRPVIVSKRLGNNGFYVICGVLTYEDNENEEKLLPVLLRLNLTGKGSMLMNLLEAYKFQNNSNQIDKFFTYTNSDTLTSNINLSNEWVDNYLAAFPNYPNFSSINLINDSSRLGPPYVTFEGNKYFNSGYLLQNLAYKTHGVHFEKYRYLWDEIIPLLNFDHKKFIESFKISSESPNSDLEIFESNIDRSNVDKPLFFIGSTSEKEKVKFNIDVKFFGSQVVNNKSFEFTLADNFQNPSNSLSTMMGFEKLKDRLNNYSSDTLSIEKLGMKYNLLCDYTTFLVLEPNDTIHFMKNPFDESLLPKDDDILIDSSYSLEQNYPNPFNPSTTIKYNIPRDSKVTLKIYDILGNEVTILIDEYKSSGKYTTVFNGSSFASGVYICRLNAGGYTFSQKMLLLK